MKILKAAKKPQIFEWIVAGVIILFCYFSFNHPDIACTATHGYGLLECIFKGNFLKFYDYAQSTAVYPITVYIMFAVWSLPVFIINKIFSIPFWGVLNHDAMTYPVLMWYKLLPTLFYFATAYLLYKIVLYIKNCENTAKWTSFLFISSPIAIFSQFIFGQYDAIGIFITIWAFFMFIKKKYYAFSLLCSLAITFKMFAVFFFIPLLLLVEKRPLHIIKHGLIAISGYIITSVMFIGSNGYRDAIGFSGNIVPRLFNNGIQTDMGTISLFTVAMMAICIIAYNKKLDQQDEFFTYAVYLPFFSFAAMFAFILWHPQWLLYLIPFLSLALFLNEKTIPSLILHSAMSIGYIGSTVICFTNNVDSNLINKGIFAVIFGTKNIASISGFFNLKGTLGPNFFYSLFAGAILILIFMYYPTNKAINCLNSKSELACENERLFIILRTLTVLIYVILTLYMFFK